MSTGLTDNPTARDIIARSILMHPSLFREACIKQAEIHDDYLRLLQGHHRPDVLAMRGARSQKNACLAIYDAIAAEDVDTIIEDCGRMVVALNIAAKLQCLPPHVRTAAAVAWDEGKR